MTLLQTPVGRLRFLGMLEGLSFLFLLGVAMPLKYLAQQSQAVHIGGMVHGVLFIAYVLMLAYIHFDQDWPLKRSAMAFGAAFVPFGPFLLERELKAL